MNFDYDCNTTKGAFALGKHLYKLPIWESRFVGFTFCGSCGVWELQCVRVAVCWSDNVWEL